MIIQREEKTGIPTELGAWPVEETSWYLGSEPKRGAPYNLNITFIPKNEEVISPSVSAFISYKSSNFDVKALGLIPFG